MLTNFNPTIIDYLFLLLTIFLAAHSFLKGFILEALSVIVLVASAVIAFILQKYISSYLDDYITLAKIAAIVSYIVSFIIVYLILRLISQLITQHFQKNIGIMDKFGGLIFGCLKSLIIAVILFSLLDLIIPNSKQPDFITTSISRSLTLSLEKSLFSNISKHNDVIDIPTPDLPDDNKAPNILNKDVPNALNTGQQSLEQNLPENLNK
ncbi:CvpA family protein [Rickettsiales bacterium LUAb2]